MTFPHIEPEFVAKKEANIPDYMQESYIKRVFAVNNAVMELKLKCSQENRNINCLECGNEECFNAFKAQAKLWGMTFEEYIDSHKKQEQEAEKAVKEQDYRYAKYYADYNMKLISGDIGKNKNGGGNKAANDKKGLFE